LPQAILASEDPASEEESVDAAASTPPDKTAPTSVSAEKNEKASGSREKSVEAKSSGKKSKNSYSIAALCQVAIFEKVQRIKDRY
jgi:hypothetical protein